MCGRRSVCMILTFQFNPLKREHNRTLSDQWYRRRNHQTHKVTTKCFVQCIWLLRRRTAKSVGVVYRFSKVCIRMGCLEKCNFLPWIEMSAFRFRKLIKNQQLEEFFHLATVAGAFMLKWNTNIGNNCQVDTKAIAYYYCRRSLGGGKCVEPFRICSESIRRMSDESHSSTTVTVIASVCQIAGHYAQAAATKLATMGCAMLCSISPACVDNFENAKVGYYNLREQLHNFFVAHDASRRVHDVCISVWQLNIRGEFCRCYKTHLLAATEIE